MKAFGLPRSIEGLFYQMPVGKSSDMDSRFAISEKTAAGGDRYGLHHFSTLNFFIETLWIENLPIVRSSPTFSAVR